MNLLARANERLKGVRVFLLAMLFALPDILNGLSGFDFNIQAPGWGSKIGACIGISRLVFIPVLMQLRRDARGPDAGGTH
jgi:hypothetical protein